MMERLDDKNRQVERIVKLPEHGDLAYCPTCGAPGEIDLDCRSKKPIFKNSIWWNSYENMWECANCYDK